MVLVPDGMITVPKWAIRVPLSLSVIDFLFLGAPTSPADNLHSALQDRQNVTGGVFEPGNIGAGIAGDALLVG